MAHQATAEVAPQPGTAYPVVLGPTFDGDRASELLTMRLDFVAASANRTADSKLQIDAETGTVSKSRPPPPHDGRCRPLTHPFPVPLSPLPQALLSVPSTTDPSAPLEFQGPFTAAEGDGGEGLDCVAVFDPATQTFRLEALHGHTNLKYMPGTKRDKAQAQKAAAAAPAAPPVQAVVPEKKDLGPVEADFFHGGMD